MKLKFVFLTLFSIIISLTLSAQTADEIIDTYFENTGGVDNWNALTSMRSKATIIQDGMEFPLTIINMKDGRQLVQFEVQGKVLTQAFDGEVAWGHNFMTMEAEKSDAEATENMKRESRDFPDPFLNYKDKGYAIELMGKETVEGVECFKIKLTKKPQLVDGQDVDNFSYFFFDTENFVPIVVETEIKSGQMKGNVSRGTFSDYDEVEGLYFPFSITEGIKDQGAQTINFTSFELNPEIDDAIFKFPETAKTSTETTTE
jgi:outer membrane lipoprotein-sorting protein